MSKWDRVRSSFERAHGDLFSDTRYEATFYNWTGGSWNPDADTFEGESRTAIGTADVEIVPPGMDTTVDVDGTSFSFDTSIRMPETVGFVDDLIPLGEDGDRPTEVAITNTKTNSTDRYELHGYTTELGSGFVMCRLVEQ